MFFFTGAVYEPTEKCLLATRNSIFIHNCRRNYSEKITAMTFFRQELDKTFTNKENWIFWYLIKAI